MTEQKNIIETPLKAKNFYLGECIGRIYNYTGSKIIIVDEDDLKLFEIPEDGFCYVEETTDALCGIINGVPILTREYYDINGLPQRVSENDFIIVMPDVFNACKNTKHELYRDRSILTFKFNSETLLDHEVLDVLYIKSFIY